MQTLPMGRTHAKHAISCLWGGTIRKMCSFIIYNLYTIFMGRIYVKIKKSVYLFVIKYYMFLVLSAWYFIVCHWYPTCCSGNHSTFSHSFMGQTLSGNLISAALSKCVYGKPILCEPYACSYYGFASVPKWPRN